MACYNSITLDASADHVWARLRKFDDLSWASGVVESVQIVEGHDASTPGAVRLINGVIRETLSDIDEPSRSIHYTLDDGPDVLAADRVKNYRATIRVRPVTATNQSFVEWESRWDTADGDVAGFCNPLYAAMLQQLSKNI